MDCSSVGGVSCKVCSYQDVLDYLNMTVDTSVFKLTRPVLDHTHTTAVKTDLILYAILSVVLYAFWCEAHQYGCPDSDILMDKGIKQYAKLFMSFYTENGLILKSVFAMGSCRVYCGKADKISTKTTTKISR